MGILSTALGNLRSSVSDAWNQGKNFISSVGSSALDAANKWSQGVSNKVNSVVGPVVDRLNNPSTLGGAIVDSMADDDVPGYVPPTNRGSSYSSGGSSGSGSVSGSGSGSSGAPSASGLNYLYADLSKHYKMDASTAFQEALANTEYSRSVEDMKRAGLNPAVLFGSSRGGHGADDNIRGKLLNSGGGSGGYSRGRYSSRGNKGYYFSSSAYSVISSLGGIVGSLATKSAGGYWVGSSLAQGAMNAISALSKWSKGK